MNTEGTMQLIITRIDGPVFNGPAHAVTVPAAEGEMTVMPHHEPYVSPLTEGVVTVRSGGDEEVFDITRGILEVSDNTVSILI